MTYVIKNSADHQVYNVMKGYNGRVLNTAETMKRHSSILNNIYAQMKGHGSSKPIRVIDEVKGISYMLRLVNNKIAKYNEKKLRSKQK